MGLALHAASINLLTCWDPCALPRAATAPGTQTNPLTSPVHALLTHSSPASHPLTTASSAAFKGEQKSWKRGLEVPGVGARLHGQRRAGAARREDWQPLPSTGQEWCLHRQPQPWLWAGEGPSSPCPCRQPQPRVAQGTSSPCPGQQRGPTAPAPGSPQQHEERVSPHTPCPALPVEPVAD